MEYESVMRRPAQWSLDAVWHRWFLIRRRITWRNVLQTVVILTAVLLLYHAYGILVSSLPRDVINYNGLDWGVAIKPPLVAKVSSTQDSDALISFKVLQIPDMHYTGDPNFPCRDPPARDVNAKCTEARMMAFIATLLDDEKPDFVVFSGDQIESVEVHHTIYQVNKALYDFSKEVIRRSIPWAMVFGNHDEGDSMSKRHMFRRINAMPFSYSEYGPLGDSGRVGNYELHISAPIDGPWGVTGKTLFRLYFFDSQDGQFTKQQMELAADLAEQYSHQHVPAIMFFHNPVPEFAAVGRAPAQGVQGEAVSHAYTNSGFLQTISQMGDVKGVFVGHDHLNDYCFEKETIHLCFGGGVGYGAAYGHPDIPRRARVIQWTWTPTQEKIVTYLHADGRAKSAEYVIYSHAATATHVGLRGGSSVLRS